MSPHVSESTYFDYLVLYLHGEFDLTTRNLLQATIDQVAALQDCRALLDLGPVDFLDCGSVRQLDTLVRSQWPEVTTVCPPGQALRILRMTGYTDHHRVVPSLREAIRAFAHPPEPDPWRRTVHVVPPAPRHSVEG